MKKHSTLFSLLFVLLTSMPLHAQYSGAWGTTWNNPSSSLASVMIQGHINKKMLERSVANQRAGKQGRTARAATKTPTSAPVRSRSTPPATAYRTLRFKPVTGSGVAKEIAYALTKDPKERSELVAIFQGIKKSYDAEAAKSGQANNLAAALTFFMAATSMAYHQTGEPDEELTDALVEILHDEMAAAPEFKRMTDIEKQKMHDWLVVSGGFVLAGYLDAVQKNDQSQLSDYKKLADEIFKVVLGMSAEKFNLAGIGTGEQ